MIRPLEGTSTQPGTSHGFDSWFVPRRQFMRIGAASFALASLPNGRLHAQGMEACAPQIPIDRSPSNGGTCPYPIPWLDKNGNRNQPAMPNVELSKSITSRGSWLGAADSTAWARTTRAIASPGVLLLPITATWQESTGQDARHAKQYSPTPDSRFSRDRRSPQTRFTIFILPSRARDCTGSHLYLPSASGSVTTANQQPSK